MDTHPLGSVADGADHTLDPRSIEVQRIGGYISTAIVALVSLAVVVIVLFAADSMPGWLRLFLPALWLVAIILLAIYSHTWPVREFRHSSYRVDDAGIEIRRGVFWRVAINVPRSRVQHTDVSQGPVQRRFGLGTLVIYTAGSDHSRVELSGLAHGVAMRLREHLLPAGDADGI